MLQGLATSGYCDVFLPGDNDPYWLAHMGEGHSVYFTVPKDCHLKGMTLCVVYLSTPENTTTECLTNVVVVNYTKCTMQIYKRDTIISFNDVDWLGIISNLGAGDKVEIFVTFRHGLVVKKTGVYLMYGDSIGKEILPPLMPMENALVRFMKKIVILAFGFFLFLYFLTTKWSSSLIPRMFWSFYCSPFVLLSPNTSSCSWLQSNSHKSQSHMDVEYLYQ